MCITNINTCSSTHTACLSHIATRTIRCMFFQNLTQTTIFVSSSGLFWFSNERIWRMFSVIPLTCERFNPMLFCWAHLSIDQSLMHYCSRKKVRFPHFFVSLFHLITPAIHLVHFAHLALKFLYAFEFFSWLMFNLCWFNRIFDLTSMATELTVT